MAEAVGFYTDTTVCIGCKACEVACHQWNALPARNGGVVPLSGLSYDNTTSLSDVDWRHVKFIEQFSPDRSQARWLMMSDICKHCVNAPCLEVCPTGSIIRTEFGGVFVQPDICNGCGYCIVSCPFGVIDRRPDDGRAFKCTFCYDRQKAGETPACAKACPTQSILFGDLDELQRVADARIAKLHGDGMHDAAIYNPTDTSVGGIHAFFLVRGDARAYNLPPKPEVPTSLLKESWSAAAVAAGVIAIASLAAFALGGRR
jgi:formate dehydrogenase iron-sulfur subunit